MEALQLDGNQSKVAWHVVADSTTQGGVLAESTVRSNGVEQVLKAKWITFSKMVMWNWTVMEGKLGRADQYVVKKPAERKGANLSNEGHCTIKQHGGETAVAIKKTMRA